jgi:hypothetical protein
MVKTHLKSRSFCLERVIINFEVYAIIKLLFPVSGLEALGSPASCSSWGLGRSLENIGLELKIPLALMLVGQKKHQHFKIK